MMTSTHAVVHICWRALNAPPTTTSSLTPPPRFLPASKGLAKLWTSPLCHWMTYWFGTSVLTDFFTTGRFTWRAWLLGTVITAQDDRWAARCHSDAGCEHV
jgi:hypothetical protein